VKGDGMDGVGIPANDASGTTLHISCGTFLPLLGAGMYAEKNVGWGGAGIFKFNYTYLSS